MYVKDLASSFASSTTDQALMTSSVLMSIVARVFEELEVSFNAIPKRVCKADAVAVRCLLVDDHAGFLAAATALLESQEISVVGTATTLDEALRVVPELRPDVVVVDVYLGPTDVGLDLARRLRDIEGPDGPVVILTSTYAGEDFEELTENAGAAGFLAKNELSAAAIRRILREHR